MSKGQDLAPVLGAWVFSQTVGGDYFIKSVASGDRFLQICCVGGRYFLRVFPWPAKDPAGAMRVAIAVDHNFAGGQCVWLGGQIDAERGVFEAELSEDVLADIIASAQSAIFVLGAGLDSPLEFPAQRAGAALKILSAASE
jgi:hypothetical protein